MRAGELPADFPNRLAPFFAQEDAANALRQSRVASAAALALRLHTTITELVGAYAWRVLQCMPEDERLELLAAEEDEYQAWYAALELPPEITAAVEALLAEHDRLLRQIAALSPRSSA